MNNRDVKKKIIQSVCKDSQTKLVHPPCLSLHVANASDEVKTYLRLTYSQYGLVNYCYQAFNCHFVNKKHTLHHNSIEYHFLKPKICVPRAPVTIFNGFSGCKW